EALRYVLETAHDEACRPAGAGPIAARPETPKETLKQTSGQKVAAPRIATPTKTASPALRPGIAG
ncbi:MAG: hypothetical protein WA425_09990, partial [Xanthobacteraceae bacterium]